MSKPKHDLADVYAIVVMGVSGCGKSTVAKQLAETLCGDYIDADDLHSSEAKQKMQKGIALDSSDRFPWLLRVGYALRSSQLNALIPVVACSALKRHYRDTLRNSANNVRFVHLNISTEAARERLEKRQGHFFSASLLDSQFDAFEPPGMTETDCLVIDAEQSIGGVLELLATVEWTQPILNRASE